MKPRLFLSDLPSPGDSMNHECGCATFGPGPHPVDARHPNVRGCEHAEGDVEPWQEWAADVTTAHELAHGEGCDCPISAAIYSEYRPAALQAELARAEEGEGTP